MPGKATTKSRRLILIVDDDDDVRDSVAGILEVAGYRVIGASDGTAALDILSRRRGIGLVLTDIRMPRMDGLELARRVAAARPSLKVLFMTGYASKVAAGTVDASRLITK